MGKGGSVKAQVRRYLRGKYTKLRVREPAGEGVDFTVLSEDLSSALFQLECKAGQKKKRPFDAPDRALGQVIRYFFENRVPTILVIPSDWKELATGRSPGWHAVVTDLLKKLGLSGSIRVITLDELEKSSI
jgi:hypothetical protein